jgi:hypothetical protein
VVPQRIAQHRMVKLVNAHVSIAAAWIAFGLFWAGTGTINAVVQSLIRAGERQATLQNYADVGIVAVTTLGMCGSVILLTWMVLQGHLNGPPQALGLFKP